MPNFRAVEAPPPDPQNSPPLRISGYAPVGAPGTWEIFATSSSQILVKAKKVLPSERRAPGSVLYGKYGRGYCITFIKRLNEGVRQQLLGQKPLISPGLYS